MDSGTNLHVYIHSNQYANTGSFCNLNSDSHGHDVADSRAYSDCHRHAFAYSDHVANPHCNIDSFLHLHPNVHTIPYTDAHAHTDCNGNSYAHADSQPRL